MAFNVTGLTNYVAENEQELLVKSVFGARTVDLLESEGTMMTGVKYAEKINLMATDAIFQDGSGCARTSSGTTTITQRQINVAPIAVIEDLCINDLNKIYLSKALKGGSNNNAMPTAFETAYTDTKAANVAKQLEIAVWQGDTTSGNANLKPFDGYIKIIDAAGTAINANQAKYVTGGPIATGTGITTANVKDIVNSMWMALPADIQGQDDIRIFCGWDTLYIFINAFTQQNLFNFAPTGNEVSIDNGVLIIPGTNYRLTAVHGLDGTNRLYSARMYNFVAATDMLDDDERWELLPDQFNDYLRFKVYFKFGVQVAFPDQIVTFKLT